MVKAPCTNKHYHHFTSTVGSTQWLGNIPWIFWQRPSVFHDSINKKNRWAIEEVISAACSELTFEQKPCFSSFMSIMLKMLRDATRNSWFIRIHFYDKSPFSHYNINKGAGRREIIMDLALSLAITTKLLPVSCFTSFFSKIMWNYNTMHLIEIIRCDGSGCLFV